MQSNETYMETLTKIRNSLAFKFYYFRAVARRWELTFDKFLALYGLGANIPSGALQSVLLRAI